MMSNRYLLIITCIILLGTWNRFYNLNSNPAWYTDEGTHVEIARHLVDGKTQYFGITDSYLIAARLPLFENLLAIWFRLFGVHLLTLRWLTSFIGVLQLVTFYCLMMQLKCHPTHSLIALALFSIYPASVIYSRFGFSYNLVSLLVLFGLVSLFQFHHEQAKQALWFSMICFGLAIITDFIAFTFIPVIALFMVYHHRQYLIPALTLCLLPFIFYSLYEISYQPEIFLHDLTYTLSRTAGLPVQQQIQNILSNLNNLSSSWWIITGFIGLWLVGKRDLTWVLLGLLLIPTLLIGKTVALYNLSAYYMIPFYPFIVLGVSNLFYLSGNFVSRYVPRRLTHLIQSMILVSIGVTTIHAVNQGFVIGIEHFLITPDDAIAVQQFVNDDANPNDVIITSPTIAWMFDNPTTDFQIASLTQADSVHFPQTLFPSRIAIDIDYQNATYAIVDNLWRDWGAVHMPIVKTILTDIQTWEIIFTSGSLKVYQNLKT